MPFFPDDDHALSDEDAARGMNYMLAQLGLQEQDDGGSWVPTHAGTPFCEKRSWTRNGEVGYTLAWNVYAVRVLMHVSGMKDFNET